MLFDRNAARLTCWLIAICLFGSARTLEAQTTGMVEFFAAGKLQKGIPLVELTNELVVMSRDGWLHSIDPRQPDSRVRSTPESFSPTPVNQLRNELQAEFGRNFEVLSTQNFLVVQPEGRGNRWAELFERSHRGFITYMSKRGVRVRQGRFPMVAIVFPDELSMYREFRKLEIDVSRVAGVYSGDSNRVITHDGGISEQTAATVRHEAAHQSAFNSGVHSRVNDNPRWITEGVGQMFEPEAITQPAGSISLANRINRPSLLYLRRSLDHKNDLKFSRIVMQLVSDDSMFEDPNQIEDAYAVSWAMMFYLAERDSGAFAELLNHTSRRPPFQPYSRTSRIQDFERITGVDTFEFSKRLSWFIDSL
jgi:hypothetical protein